MSLYDYGNFDFIIVGAGAAGSVIANRLSEIKKWKILLLEAGGEQTDFSYIPGFMGALVNSDMNWGYMSTPQKLACLGTVGSRCVSTRGKVLGGSTVLNGKMMVRGNRDDYDGWARLGNRGWSYKEVLPYFIKSETSHIPDRDLLYHGVIGPLDVSYFDDTFVTTTFIKGMQELGYDSVDYNGRHQIGASRTQSTLLKNRAATANSAFIEPIRHRRWNLNVTINALVSKILIDNVTRTAHGVEFIKGGRRYVAKASHEVILSAGSINSPQLLMLSGIGPEDELRKIKVDPVLNLPVGQKLQDHIMLYGVCFHTNRTLFNTSLEQNLRWYLNNQRPYTSAYYLDGTGFINVDESNNGTSPNIQFINVAMPGVDFSAPFLNFNQEVRSGYFESYNRFTDFLMHIVLLRPKSFGNITLQSNSIIDFPILDYNYLSDPEDVETIYKGVQHALKLLNTDSFKFYNVTLSNPAKYCGDPNSSSSSREYWYCVIRTLSTTIYHPVGTTKMGNSPKCSVVDPELMVHGMKKLRVADAGIMPEITSGNIQAAVYMIGEKVSDLIKLKYLKKLVDPLGVIPSNLL